MKIRRMLCALCALVALCALTPAASAEVFTVEQALHESLPAFRFSLNYAMENELFYTDALTITRADDGGNVQQIVLATRAETYDDETLGLVIEDMNFDGYLDMRLMQFISAGINIPYFCWLWDPAAQTFVYSEPLSAIASPSFDPETRLVYSSERDGASIYIENTYTYAQDGSLTLTARVTSAYDSDINIVIITTEELVDGQMQVTNRQEEPLQEDVEGDNG